jgi:hypothetical protein
MPTENEDVQEVQENQDVQSVQDTPKQQAVDANATRMYAVLNEQANEIEKLRQQLQAKNVAEEKEESIDDMFDLDKSVSDKLPPENADERFENLSKKQLVEVMCNAMEDALCKQQEVMKKDITKSFEPSIKKLDDVERLAMKMVASMSISDIRSKYKDFDQHKESVGKTLERYPGMSIEDAYILAKSKTAGSVPPAKQMETEKTSGVMTLPTRAAQDRADTGSSDSTGIAGFRRSLYDALDKIVK